VNNLNFGALLLGVGVLGGLGSVVRLALSQWHRWLPWGILTGNTLASVVVGATFPISQSARADALLLTVLLATGFAGGLSTFSTWAAQTVDFFAGDKTRQAYFNFLLNLALPVLGVIVGVIIGSLLLK